MSNKQEIRALYDQDSIVVYQAYCSEIALNALRCQRFVPPFKMGRMTWIKPSFLWMMYRSGWASKAGQEHVLAVRITRQGFDWALQHACLASYDNSLYQSHQKWRQCLDISPVRIQWDPEKDICLNSLDYRSIQIGLKGEAVERYVQEWIVEIQDISIQCRHIGLLIQQGQVVEAMNLMPEERIYTPFA